MSKPVYYKQCKIHREEGNVTKTCWILEKLCVKGRTLTSKEDDSYGDLWTVLEVYDSKVEESMLPDHNKIARSHRRATGDSLPKNEN